MRVLVCGARDYTDKVKIWQELDKIYEQHPDMYVIEGKCPKGGADLFAEQWARYKLKPDKHLQFPADWKRYGRAAGPIRNKQMLREGKPDLVLAFGGKNGTGTNNMVSIANVEVKEFDRD